MFERFTLRSRRAIVLAQEEARLLDHNYIGTEHLLLGLIAEGDGVGSQILERLGAPAETVRERVVELARTEPEPETEPPGEPAGFAVPGLQARPLRVRMESIGEVRDLLKSIDRRLAAIERHLGIAPGEESSSPAAADPPPGEPPSAAAE